MGVIDLLKKIKKKVDELGYRVDEIGRRVDELGHRVDKIGRRVDEIGHRVEELNYRVGFHDFLLRNIGNPSLGVSSNHHSFVNYPESLWNSVTRPDHR